MDVSETAPKKHTYPSEYKPGKHWAIDEAWKVLDVLPIGFLSEEQRFLIAGIITALLVKHARR